MIFLGCRWALNLKKTSRHKVRSLFTLSFYIISFFGTRLFLYFCFFAWKSHLQNTPSVIEIITLSLFQIEDREVQYLQLNHNQLGLALFL